MDNIVFMLLLQLVLIALNAIFACAEIAVISMNENKLDKLAEQLGTGVPTLKDIVAELIKPVRDMRDALPKPLLRTDVLDMTPIQRMLEINYFKEVKKKEKEALSGSS